LRYRLIASVGESGIFGSFAAIQCRRGFRPFNLRALVSSSHPSLSGPGTSGWCWNQYRLHEGEECLYLGALCQGSAQKPLTASTTWGLSCSLVFCISTDQGLVFRIPQPAHAFHPCLCVLRSLDRRVVATRSHHGAGCSTTLVENLERGKFGYFSALDGNCPPRPREITYAVGVEKSP